MFDIGFSEIVLCLLVGLVVIGPEQLPQAVRTVALWVGRLKRSLRDTREEIERQLGADDIRRQLHNEEIMRSLREANERINETMQSITQEPSASVTASQSEVTPALEATPVTGATPAPEATAAIELTSETAAEPTHRESTTVSSSESPTPITHSADAAQKDTSVSLATADTGTVSHNESSSRS